jgi:3-hydroxybutyryl-CoA dehydrogenase
MARTIDKVGVVGLGQMGAGIVEVYARSGLTVVGVEPTEDALERGRGHLTRSTDRAVQRGRLSADDQQAIFDRVTFTTSLADVKDCGLVIEAVPELLDVKQAIFRELDQVCDPATVLATNTSSLSVTEIATATARPAQVVGMHFFNPAPVLPLVEVIPCELTSVESVERVHEFAHGKLGKTIITAKDRAGFVVNALLIPYLLSAIRMVDAGLASAEDIDTGMVAGCAHPMGPLALTDLIGLDTAAAVAVSMYEETKEQLYAPPALLLRKVEAGDLGRKTGRGFFTYR